MTAAAPHEVLNQSTPYADVDLWAANRPLRDAVAAHAPQRATAGLAALGRLAGPAAMQAHARLANANRPQLQTHDLQGRRIDSVEFHPSYHALLGAALAQGLHGTPWAAAAAGSHVERAAAFLLFTECEPSVLCPVSMSYAVTPALRANLALHAAWGPGLASTAYDPRDLPFDRKTALTIGMGMTEKQGGSDVRANTTRAEPEGDDAWGRRHAVTGHKWFFSAPMSDAFLVLAQTAAGPSCFFMPRWLPDGTRNAIRIQRLKDKLGNHANASAEVEFEGASAWLVGEEGRGVPQILAMGALTRLDCALGSAGLMRQALGLAVHHARQRRAFGKPLVDQPLMANVLADLALESEAATAMALRLAAAVDWTEGGAGDGEGEGDGGSLAPSPRPSPAGGRGSGRGSDAGHEAVMRRVLTPLAKFWVCKRGAGFAQEAMECLGGNGYVEAGGAGVMARVYREMPLNSIWEGAGNVMALDLQRVLRGADVAPALEHEWAPARGRHPAFDAEAAAALRAVADGGAADQSQLRPLARRLALLLQASLLHRHAPQAVFDAFCDTRLAQASDVYGLVPARHDLRALVDRALPAA